MSKRFTVKQRAYEFVFLNLFNHLNHMLLERHMDPLLNAVLDSQVHWAGREVLTAGQ
jgi:hypothetical protein